MEVDLSSESMKIFCATAKFHLRFQLKLKLKDHYQNEKSFLQRKLAVSVRNLKFTRNLKFSTSKTLVNFVKKMMYLSKNWYFSVQKALIYYTVNKSHHNSFILLVFLHMVNFRYVANFTFRTLIPQSQYRQYPLR